MTPPFSTSHITLNRKSPQISTKKEKMESLTRFASIETDIADLCDKSQEHKEHQLNSSKPPCSLNIIWRNVAIFSALHLVSLYSVYLAFTSAMWQTNLFAFLLSIISGLGVTAGAHRLWAHRSYKAKLLLRIFLAFLFTITFEHDIYDWVRDHRVHHKYSETDADPHNAKRGFFFSHIGWLMCRKHPDVIRKGKKMDLTDILSDPVVRFQRKYYCILAILCCFVLPTIIPMIVWRESLSNAFLIPGLLRLCCTLNQTWLVNSAAHLWGYRPYDVNINPRESPFVVIFAAGEGFHNYHHTFPYDYSASEYGTFNITTAFINTMAFLGLAYDCKKASKTVIHARKLRTGPNKFNNTRC